MLHSYTIRLFFLNAALVHTVKGVYTNVQGFPKSEILSEFRMTLRFLGITDTCFLTALWTRGQKRHPLQTPHPLEQAATPHQRQIQ